MALPNFDPRLSATITWLTEGARTASKPQDVLQQLCSQLSAAGLAIDRAAVFVTTLHPSVMGRRFLWNPGDDVKVDEAGYTSLESIDSFEIRGFEKRPDVFAPIGEKAG
jgi:adenylate cyclase